MTHFLQVSEIEEIEEDTIGDYEDDVFEEPSDEEFFDDPSIGNDHRLRNRRRRGEFNFTIFYLWLLPSAHHCEAKLFVNRVILDFKSYRISTK